MSAIACPGKGGVSGMSFTWYTVPCMHFGDGGEEVSKRECGGTWICWRFQRGGRGDMCTCGEEQPM